MQFKNPTLQAQFEKDGYCKVRLLSDELQDKLRQFAKEHILAEEVSNTDYGMYVSLEESDEKKHRITRFVRDHMGPVLEEHLKGHKIHLGGYLIKAPDDRKYTFPHQDWIFVDQNTTDVSATIWISLYDLEEENGTLGFLKGSHRFLNHVIGSPSPIVPTPSMGKETVLFSHLKFEPVKAGEALIFNNKTIHAAMPNSGDFYRVAVGIGITPADTSLYHYFLNPENPKEFLKLEVEEAFFMMYNNDDLLHCYQTRTLPDHCRVVGKLPVNQEQYPDLPTLQDTILSFGNVPNGHEMNLQKHFGQPEEEKEQAEPETSMDSADEVDNRTFFQTYTPLNIYREARYRLSNLFLK